MISNVYHYYLSQYAHKSNARYDSHKKSELRNTYNKMQQINKVTPFYKIDISDEAQKYAIDLKEHARDLTNIANDLSEDEYGSLSFKKSADSSNEDCVSVDFVGDSNCPPTDTFEINIKQIADSQINTGNYLQPNSKFIESGDYSFDLSISDLTYQFEFNIKDSETTNDLQNKISRLINRSNIGIHSEILSDSLGNTAISIESENTGIISNKPTIFSIIQNSSSTTDSNDSGSSKKQVVDTLGLNRVTQYPTNAIFSVNGEDRVSTSNYFTINNAFEVQLKKVTDSKPVTISLSNDNNDIVNSIEELVASYNNLISVTNSDQNHMFSGNEKLRNAFTHLTQSNTSSLAESGLLIADDGSISVNSDSISEIVSNGCLLDALNNIKQFKNSIQDKAEIICLNPMDYVNNKIVAYKNPIKSFSDPYNTSMYSGMMFNGYI